MAEELDRAESNGNGYANGNGNGYGRTFVLGLLTGATVGAGLGLLFAPKKGSQLRHQIGEQASSLANTTSATYRKASDKAVTGWKTARNIYDKAREGATMQV